MQNQEQEDYHFLFKVVVLGDTKSGKSTFLDSKIKYKIIYFNIYKIIFIYSIN
jgi:GTPase SAR1 family protein